MHIPYNSIFYEGAKTKLPIKIRFRLGYLQNLLSSPLSLLPRSRFKPWRTFCCEIASACETSLENKISLLQHAKCLYELFQASFSSGFSFYGSRFSFHVSSFHCDGCRIVTRLFLLSISKIKLHESFTRCVFRPASNDYCAMPSSSIRSFEIFMIPRRCCADI